MTPINIILKTSQGDLIKSFLSKLVKSKNKGFLITKDYIYLGKTYNMIRNTNALATYDFDELIKILQIKFVNPSPMSKYI